VLTPCTHAPIILIKLSHTLTVGLHRPRYHCSIFRGVLSQKFLAMLQVLHPVFLLGSRFSNCVVLTGL
jgi:hypothetical protein